MNKTLEGIREESGRNLDEKVSSSTLVFGQLADETSGVFELGYGVRKSFEENKEELLSEYTKTEDLPDKLPNPTPIKVLGKSGEVVKTYDGSLEQTVSAKDLGAVTDISTLSVKDASGETTKTFNGSEDIEITAEDLGAVTEIPESIKNPSAIKVKDLTGKNTVSYDGSEEKEIDATSLGLDPVIEKVNANESAISVLNGNEETEGSVEKKIKDAFEGISSFKIEIVDALPETGVSSTFYFVKLSDELKTEDNQYEEYVWINDRFEYLGTRTTVAIDMKDYLKVADLQGEIDKLGTMVKKAETDSNGHRFRVNIASQTASGYKMHDGTQSNGLYIESDMGSGDCGGVAIDNDGVTAYGAGDRGYVFRVVNEDNVDEGAQFEVTKASGTNVKHGLNVDGNPVALTKDIPTSLPADGGNADTLTCTDSGFSKSTRPSISAVDHTLVQRDPSGCVYLKNIKMLNDVEDNRTPANIFFDTGDGFLRKMSSNTFMSNALFNFIDFSRCKMPNGMDRFNFMRQIELVDYNMTLVSEPELRNISLTNEKNLWSDGANVYLDTWYSANQQTHYIFDPEKETFVEHTWKGIGTNLFRGGQYSVNGDIYTVIYLGSYNYKVYKLKKGTEEWIDTGYTAPGPGENIVISYDGKIYFWTGNSWTYLDEDSMTWESSSFSGSNATVTTWWTDGESIYSNIRPHNCKKLNESTGMWEYDSVPFEGMSYPNDYPTDSTPKNLFKIGDELYLIGVSSPNLYSFKLNKSKKIWERITFDIGTASWATVFQYRDKVYLLKRNLYGDTYSLYRLNTQVKGFFANPEENPVRFKYASPIRELETTCKTFIV